MAEVDTSIYKNQPDPLGTASKVFGLLNTQAQNQLLQTATQQRALELQQSQANDLLTSVAPLANKPGLTQAELNATLADRARQLGINGKPVYDIAAKRYQGPDWQNNLKLDAVRSLGPASLGARQEVTDPRTGARTSLPLAATIGTQYPTALPAGQQAIFEGPAGAQGINDLLEIPKNAPMQRANLENLNALSKEAVSGPSSDFEVRANAFMQRIIPGFKGTLTAEQLSNSEEYKKITEQIAGQQATSGHSTNAFLTNAYNTNPGLYLSKIGREGITHMLQGNLDANVAKANEWTEANLTPADFAKWNKDFNKDFNPRVFQYARMTPDERSKFRSTLPANQQKKFFDQIQGYQQKGWIDLGG